MWTGSSVPHVQAWEIKHTELTFDEEVAQGERNSENLQTKDNHIMTVT